MNSPFVNSLVAAGSHPAVHEQLKLYEPLIGSWDFDWVGHNGNGTTWTVPGEWIFSWVLEGRAIQDNWICPSIELRSTGKYPTGQYGTTIRFYDKEEDCIKVVWVGAANPQVNLFRVTFIDNQIIQQEIAIGKKPSLSKWVIKDITSESFKWEALISENEGKEWQLTQEVFARRKD